MSDLKDMVVALARERGFDLVGVTSADEFASDRSAALERVREGRMEGLPWYTESRVMRGTSPAELLPGARSVICLGLSYWSGDEGEAEERASTGPGQTVVGTGLSDGERGQADTGEGYMAKVADGERGQADTGNGHITKVANAHATGRVARYAWVRDYHRVMKRRMRDLVRELEKELGSGMAARWYVDDGPMLDRAAANRAGIGWFGKNTNILTPQFGSWVFLGQIITDLELEPDAPLQKSCGACVRCIDDCPTGAIVAPYVVDNSRCISYLTIENRGSIARELRPLMQDWVFGCDICQDVCPVNRKAQPAGQPIPFPGNAGRSGPSPASGQGTRLAALDLAELLEMSDHEFLARFAGTSIMRAKPVGMQRNACVALGNLADPAAIPALTSALLHPEPLVRGHAAWALGRIGGRQAEAALLEAAAFETDPDVVEEISAALGELTLDRSLR